MAMFLVDNCIAHQIDESYLPCGISLLFLTPIFTITGQPTDMGMIESLKVGYKSIILTYLLNIFDEEGGYKDVSR